MTGEAAHHQWHSESVLRLPCIPALQICVYQDHEPESTGKIATVIRICMLEYCAIRSDAGASLRIYCACSGLSALCILRDQPSLTQAAGQAFVQKFDCKTADCLDVSRCFSVVYSDHTSGPMIWVRVCRWRSRQLLLCYYY